MGTNSRQLTETGWDLFLDGDNRIARLYDKDRVKQNIRERLQFFYGEWFLDVTRGVPWFQRIFVKPVSKGLIKSIIKRTIINTKDVNKLLELNVDIDFANRTLSVLEFAVDTTYGPLEGDI